jgi:arylsulfatase A-like enzyme/Flp pilus assembly protein TadD
MSEEVRGTRGTPRNAEEPRVSQPRVLVMIAATAVLVLGGCRGEKPNAARTYRNAPVIIISVDTLRADRLPAYGYTKVKTPAIDRLRADSILYRNAYAQVPLTLPSHASMLTGKLPNEIGIRDNVGYRFESGAHPSIPSLLRANGYATGAAVSSYVLRADTGLGAVFDWYDDATDVLRNVTIGELQRSGDKTAGSASNWVQSQGDEPFFLLLHLYEPHTPYDPPEPYRTQYAGSPYDGEIAATDEILGRFLEGLKASGVYDRSIIIFMSDHGEGLWDHGEEEHGIFLYREAIHVPLMVKLPASHGGGDAVDAPVQLADIFPTVGALLGIRFPETGAVSLLETAAGKPPAQRAIYSETYYPQIHFGWSRLRSLVDAQHQYIEAPRPELYDNLADPQQKNDLSAERRRVRSAMRSDLQQIPENFAGPSAIDPEEAAKLAALGYLGSTASTTGGPLPDPKDRITTVKKFRDGVALVAARKNREAIGLFRSILDQDPGITDVWAQLGKAYEQLGEFDEALAAYREATQRSPAVAQKFVLSMASVHLQKNEVEEAESHARAGYSADPELANLILGVVALERRNFPAAEAHARAAMKSSLYRDSAIVLTARSNARQGRFAEAVRVLDDLSRQLAERGTAPPPLLEYVRGDALMRLGRIEEAEAAFLREIDDYPGDTEAWGSLGAIYLSQGDPNKAAALMERLVRTNPRPANFLLAAQLFGHFGEEKLAKSWRDRAERMVAAQQR